MTYEEAMEVVRLFNSKFPIGTRGILARKSGVMTAVCTASQAFPLKDIKGVRPYIRVDGWDDPVLLTQFFPHETQGNNDGTGSL